MPDRLTGWAAEQMLNAALDNPTATAMYEGICAGNAQWEVKGVAVCYAPTVDALRRAAAEGRTLIVSREHPYFLHGGVNCGYATGGLEAALKDDPVVKAKRELIDSNKIIVFRCGAAWDSYNPKAQSLALAKAMGFKPDAPQPANRARGVFCTTAPATVAELAKTAAGKLKCNVPRIVGDPHLRVTRVAALAGETDPKREIAGLLRDQKLGCIVAGAGGIVDEVDGAISYFRDAITSGRKTALLAVGYGPSQNPGCEEMAKWVRSALPGHDVQWWPATDPAWIPRPAGS